MVCWSCESQTFANRFWVWASRGLWQTRGWVWKQTKVDVFVEDGVLTVDAMAGLMSGADITIAVPEGLPVRGRVERGDLCVEMEEPSHIDACVAAGSVYIGVPEGEYRLALDVGAGDVSVDGVVHSDTASRVIHGCVAAGDLSVYALPESDESFGGSR